MGVDRMETKELRQSNRNGARVGDIELVYIINRDDKKRILASLAISESLDC